MHKMKKSLGSHIFDCINHIFFIGVILVCIVPILHVVFASFSDPNWVLAQKGLILRIKGFNIEGYKLVFQNKNIMTGYLNTIFYVVVGTGLGMIITCMSAYVLSRKQFLWTNVFMLIITIPMLFSGGIIPLYIVVTQDLGLYDSRWAIILPSCVSAFNVIMVRTAMQAIPESLEESAKLDGAGHFTIMWRIILPMVKSTLAVVVLYYAVGHWNSWFSAAIYLRDRTKYPLQLIIKEILISNDTASTTSAAAADGIMYKELVKYCTIVVSSVPVFVLYPFVQKHFKSGVMIGAVKG